MQGSRHRNSRLRCRSNTHMFLRYRDAVPGDAQEGQTDLPSSLGLPHHLYDFGVRRSLHTPRSDGHHYIPRPHPSFLECRIPLVEALHHHALIEKPSVILGFHDEKPKAFSWRYLVVHPRMMVNVKTNAVYKLACQSDQCTVPIALSFALDKYGLLTLTSTHSNLVSGRAHPVLVRVVVMSRLVLMLESTTRSPKVYRTRSLHKCSWAVL